MENLSFRMRALCILLATAATMYVCVFLLPLHIIIIIKIMDCKEERGRKGKREREREMRYSYSFLAFLSTTTINSLSHARKMVASQNFTHRAGMHSGTARNMAVRTTKMRNVSFCSLLIIMKIRNNGLLSAPMNYIFPFKNGIHFTLFVGCTPSPAKTRKRRWNKKKNANNARGACMRNVRVCRVSHKFRATQMAFFPPFIANGSYSYHNIAYARVLSL